MPATRPSARGAVITGWGTALPPKVLTNRDLQDMGLDTSDEWIVERTGIRERRVGGTTAGLSAEAGRGALDMSGLDPASIDALVLATTTPDRTVPATSATVQNELGLSCGAFDINAACSGFTYALVVAHGLIAMGAERILVIGTDTLARITDWEDRNTAVLFADGSGAVVLEAVDGGGQLLAWDLDADGSAEPLLYAEIGGYHADGRQGGVPPGGADHGRLGHQVDGARRRDGRRHRPRRPPPGEHPHHRGRLRPPRHRHRPGRRSCSTAPATRRRRRSRSPSSTPSTTGGCTTAT